MNGQPIDWGGVGRQLARLADVARPARLLSVTLPLPFLPDVDVPGMGDWFVWRRPDRQQRLCGIGKAFTVTTAGAGRFAVLHAAHGGLLADWRHAQAGAVPPPLACLGFAFAPRGGGPLPNAALWVPELLLREEHGSAWATFSCAASDVDAAPARWQALWQSLAAAPAVDAMPRLEPCRHPLAERAFLARGRAAVRAIDSGALDKLVLTRSIRLRGEKPLAVAPILDALAAQHANCATFGVGRAGRAFIGASPETLLRLDGARVEVDALAGTAWRADAIAAPGTASPLSLGADKNRREHDFVARAVAQALAAQCHDVAVPAAPEGLQLDALEHLRRRVVATRRADVSALDLIARLHPTPAVGGTPSAATLDWLAHHGDRRGAWYTGGIGWLDAAGNAEVAVALRCGLLYGREATLFAGAGFVAGSDPAQELAETEAKFSVMRAALAAGAVSTRQQAA